MHDTMQAACLFSASAEQQCVLKQNTAQTFEPKCHQWSITIYDNIPNNSLSWYQSPISFCMSSPENPYLSAILPNSLWPNISGAGLTLLMISCGMQMPMYEVYYLDYRLTWKATTHCIQD